MKNPLGHKRWAIAEGYLPTASHGPEPEMTSHETACLLNTSEQDAHVEIMIYFSDRDPVGPYSVAVPARRTRHIRFNDLPRDRRPHSDSAKFSEAWQSDCGDAELLDDGIRCWREQRRKLPAG